jgi:antitoxin (DNA-binding transcriptional repressor) of toxin-antitoxin stability system
MTISIEQAQASLGEVIRDSAASGETVVITRDQQAVAELTAVPPRRPTPVFGSCRGMLTILSDDDEHLSDFAPYMP